MKDDHIADAGNMVPTEWVATATNAYWLDVGGNTESGITAAIAAVAPLIAAQERERCAAIAENHEWFVGGIGTKAPGSGQASAIAAAIRAVAPLTTAAEPERCYEIAPTLVKIERAICCPSGTCTSPNNCYAEDHTRSYPVQIQDAAKAVAKLYRGD
jgi:hypothetical protein